MPFWYPVCDHPDVGGPAWYVADHVGHVYRSRGHPLGASDELAFHVVDDLAYPGHCGPADTDLACYRIRGSMISPAEGHPRGASDTPWYQMRG
jgi:hypothetical protein